jgi:hypothetical protein
MCNFFTLLNSGNSPSLKMFAKCFVTFDLSVSNRAVLLRCRRGCHADAQHQSGKYLATRLD